MDRTIYSTEELLGVLYDERFEPVSSFWLQNYFSNGQVNFEGEDIEFEKLTDDRQLAPLVTPLADGKPVYTERSNRSKYRPAYFKPEDMVGPERVITRRPGELAQTARLSNQQRRNAYIADIMFTHRRTIERSWEWLAAQAMLYGQVTLTSDSYPTAVVDFGRDPSHTVIKTPGQYWGEAGVSIVDDIERWRERCYDAEYGGMVNRMVVGTEAFKPMRKDEEFMKQLDTQIRGTDGNFRTGIVDGMEVEFMGRLSSSLEVWRYRDYFTQNGVQQQYMDPRDVLLTGPNVRGMRAFGAILHDEASYAALDMFPYMYQDVKNRIPGIVTHSAPLMVPVNPNATLRARVVA